MHGRANVTQSKVGGELPKKCVFVRRLDHFLLGSSVCRSSWPVEQVADRLAINERVNKYKNRLMGSSVTWRKRAPVEI